jgi:hypothetical protein
MSADPAAKPARRRPHWIVWPFALVGLLGMLAIIFIAIVLFGVQRSYQRAPRIAGAAPEVTFTLGNVEPLRGTNLVKIDISASEGGGSASYSGRGEDVRNILLLDKVSGSSRKLLPDNQRRIAQARFFSAEADIVDSDSELPGTGSGQEAPPIAYYTLLVEAPPSGGSSELIAGMLNSGHQGVVMRGIEGVDSMWMQSPTTIGMLVREKLNLYHRIVDIPTLKVVHSKRVPVD